MKITWITKFPGSLWNFKHNGIMHDLGPMIAEDSERTGCKEYSVYNPRGTPLYFIYRDQKHELAAA